MAERLHFDVLVVGSGASGLAAAVSAEKAGARVGLVTKGALQSCNSAKAQGGIQAAFGEDDSPEQHAEDVWTSSHETADRRLAEILTGEAPGALRRCYPQAPPPGRRPDGPRDHEGAQGDGGGRGDRDVPEVASRRPRAH